MSEINPLEIEKGEALKVSDKDSKYHGKVGDAIVVYLDRVTIDLHSEVGGQLITFDLEQVEKL